MAQKTIDFENDILRPIGSLKEEISDSLGEFRYHGKFVPERKYSTIETSIAPKKGDLIFLEQTKIIVHYLYKLTCFCITQIMIMIQ